MSLPSERPRRGEGLEVAIEGTLPPGPWRLAETPWPRSGGCARNARRTSVVGPRRGVLEETFALPGKPNPTRQRYARSGVATSTDGFRVTSRRRLFAFDEAGALRWETRLLEDSSSRYEAGPLVLEGDLTVVGLDHAIAFVDSEGSVRARVEVTGDGLDDTGHAPNLTRDGRLILTGPLREVSLLDPSGVAYSLGEHGLDIPPPAVALDGSLVLAGFSGVGLARLDPEGQVLARSPFLAVDQMPSVAENGTMIAGSSLGTAQVCEPDGTLTARLRGQIAGEVEDGWVVMSYGALRRYDAAGALRWETPLGDEVEVGWHLRMVVDAEGYAYCALPESLVCIDPEGGMAFEASLPERPTDLAPIAPGVMAVVTTRRVFLLR